MLPKWMQEAIRDNVLSPEEATEIHSISLAATTEEVLLPLHLHEAASRIYLWERPTPAMPV